MWPALDICVPGTSWLGSVLSCSPNPDPRLYFRSIPMRQMWGKTPPGIFVVFTYGDRHYKLLTIKHIKWRQRLNADVFEASTLRFFIISFKRCYDEYLLWFFLHFLLKFKPFDEFFPFQNMIANLSVCVASVCVCVCVCTSINWIKTSLKLSLALFFIAFYKRW